MCSLIPAIREFNPDVIVAIGGGGFIPARMLRTELRVPILAVSLELYDDETLTARTQVVKKQWFDETSGSGRLVRGKRVLIVDEVDDSRTTLQFCVEEIMTTNAPSAMAVVVVHNKDKPKRGVLPDDVQYFAGETVPDMWNCYPWDAHAYDRSIRDHEALAVSLREAERKEAQQQEAGSGDDSTDSSTATTTTCEQRSCRPAAVGLSPATVATAVAAAAAGAFFAGYLYGTRE